MPNSTNPPSREPHRSASELRLDWVTGNYHVLARERENRPNEFVRDADPPFAESCSFCAGREAETTPTEASYPPPPQVGHPHPWQVRVVENLYPIFNSATVPQLPPSYRGLPGQSAQRHNAGGYHYVIIESPTHRRRITELEPGEVAMVFRAYRDQLQRLRNLPAVASVLLFKNSGRDAGMSREHLHSQIVAWPNVPPTLLWELAGARRFFELHRQCVFCALLAESMTESSRTVQLGNSVVAFCPFASRVAYETWVMPRTHAASFDECSDEVIDELACVMHHLLSALESCLGPIAYNYLLHTIPFNSTDKHEYHWHFEIIPRLSQLAGLEWGSGVLVNTVAPELAAENLRAAGGGDE